jgi:transposase
VTGKQWYLIVSVLPVSPKRGRPRADDRQTLNGIPYVLTTRCAWGALPPMYPHYATYWRRSIQWHQSGIWQQIAQILIAYGHLFHTRTPENPSCVLAVTRQNVIFCLMHDKDRMLLRRCLKSLCLLACGRRHAADERSPRRMAAAGLRARGERCARDGADIL